jgi:hypothetical protein
MERKEFWKVDDEEEKKVCDGEEKKEGERYFTHSRERKNKENKIFWGPNQLNTPFVCYYQITLGLKRIKYDSNTFPV